MIDADYLADVYTRVVPGTEAATFLSRQPVPANAENTFQPTSLNYAKRKPASLDQMVAIGATLGTTVLVWQVWAQDLGTTVPKYGDRITDGDGVTYEVRHVDAARLIGNVWNCTCIQDVS